MIANIFLIIIRFYQYFISPLFGPKCRFYPTCSKYSYQAIKLYGVRGLFLVIKRIFKCHPFSKFQYYDPIPEIKQNKVYHD